MAAQAPIAAVSARAYKIPTDLPEADGTLAWDSTTLVMARIEAAGMAGLGYTYSDPCDAPLINGVLGPLLEGRDAFDIPECCNALWRHVRNIGRSGLAATAISALDAALWDLKAKCLGLPLARLLGQARASVPIYGSGGFTTYTDEQLRSQLGAWVERDGCRWVKMKIGTHPGQDPDRMAVARTAIGDADLFVDANGAFTPKQALGLAAAMLAEGVTWFEEPVSSDDVAGLRRVRERMPEPIEVAAGEYGYTLDDFRHWLTGEAVDVIQADATRCGGVSGFLAAAVLAEAHHTDISGHCAPALHLHPACAAPRLRHLEWFHDHVRIEQMLFDGAPDPMDGEIVPDLSRPGFGLDFKTRDAEAYAV
jgi:L-alanine-DL-glutamate epimerase-like enolase superfamily enzyme